MILMVTLHYPAQMTEKVVETAMAMGTPPEYVKKWLTFGSNSDPKGFKEINIIYVEKGHADEASIELSKMFIPFAQLGNVELTSEVLYSVRDTLEIWKK